MKAPEECSGLHEVRAEIDAIDRDIVALIARRRGYVLAASAFKANEASVSAPDRVTEMMARRRQWALDAGLDPDPVAQLFRTLASYFTDAERQHWKGRHG